MAYQYGTLTQLSGTTTSLMMLLTLLFLTPLVYCLPKFALAAIVITSVIPLVAFQQAIMLWRPKRVDLFLWVTSFLGVLFIGVLEGIAIAVILTHVVVIYESARPQMVVLWHIPGTSIYCNMKQENSGAFVPNVLIVRIGASMCHWRKRQMWAQTSRARTSTVLEQDDKRNPACFAGKVGDNVGDIAGMGADLFGSFAEATCVALVLVTSSNDLQSSWKMLMYPVLISSLGIVVGIVMLTLRNVIYRVHGEFGAGGLGGHNGAYCYQGYSFHSFRWRVSEASQRAVFARSSLEAEIRVDEQRHLHGEPVARLDSVPECVMGYIYSSLGEGDSFKIRLSRVGCTMRAVTAFISLPLAGGGDDREEAALIICYTENQR